MNIDEGTCPGYYQGLWRVGKNFNCGETPQVSSAQSSKQVDMKLLTSPDTRPKL